MGWGFTGGEPFHPASDTNIAEIIRLTAAKPGTRVLTP
jgi:hypothetical protein